MKKSLFLTSLAVLALSSCSDNEFLGSEEAQHVANGDKAISFVSGANALTRGTLSHEKSAEALNKKFVVEGDKSSDGANFKTVFDDYTVSYGADSKNTTESNTHDWEYVGGAPATTSGVAGERQSIKYWDYSAKLYNFAAYSLGTGNATASAISVTPNPATGEIRSYTLTGTAANLAKCYISDLVTAYNQVGVSDFGQTVTLSFRSLGTKVRVAFYETVPGYSVKGVEFYASDVATSSSDDVTLYSASGNLPAGEGTMTVCFPTTGWDNRDKSDYNKAHVAFTPKTSGDVSSTLVFSDNLLYTGKDNKEADGNIYLGRTSSGATYAKASTDGATGYNVVLPNEDGANLQLRVKYTLVSTDGSGEEIVVDNARAVVPAAYAAWKPNYAYTYIFKISDNTNGSTGVDGDGNIVVGLTPITFDAVVEESEDGIQETITTVATPSITTYQKGKVVTAKNEYEAGDVYVSVMNGTTPVTLTDSPANYGVYLVTEGADKVTEAIAQDMLSGVKTNTGITWTPAIYEAVNEVPAVDGNTLSVSAAKFAAAAGKTYVFDVIVGGKNYVKIIKVAAAPAPVAP